MATIAELRRQPHWSYSAFNTYLNVCQLQFRFRYLEQAEVEQTSACFVFGRAFHAALTQQALKCKAGGALTPAEALELFAEYFKIELAAAPEIRFKSGEDRDTMIALAGRMLEAALAGWRDGVVLGAATAFKVQVPGLDKPLIGEFDMLAGEGRELCIVDWKTSAGRWPAGKANRDLQATVFSYALRRMTGRTPLFRFDVVTKTKNPNCESHHTSRGFDDFRRFEVLAAQVQDAVNKEVFLPNETSFACAECPYANRCRQWHQKVR